MTYGTAPSGQADTYATHRMRGALRGSHQSAAAAVWAGMHQAARLLIVSMATDRADVATAARLPWESFAPAERIAMGAAARQINRDTAMAGALR